MPPAVGPRTIDERGTIERQLLAIDLLGMPAFACDAMGRVVEMNPSAWRLTSRDRLFAIRHGRLDPLDIGTREAFHSAIAGAAANQHAPTRSLLSRVNGDCGDYVRIDVRPLPGLRASLRPASVLVICHIAPADDFLAVDLLQSTFGLTRAEADVALLMARAERFPDIARMRSVSEHTVRTQCKILFSKLGVSTQAQLVHKLRAVTG